MGISRNCPIDMWNADVVTRYSDMEPLVFKIQDIDMLLKELTKECKEMIKSDGELWADTPEIWLRKQLNLVGGWKQFVSVSEGEQ